MGFLTSCEGVVLRAAARAMIPPPPPPDITRWCEENIVFDERSPMPGPFRIEKFPFLREIHEVLSPEHPATEVTVAKSAQIGGTVSIAQPTLGSWFSYAPVDALVIHPTQSAATEWANNKWAPMRRSAPDLLRIFGSGRSNNIDNTFNQETLARNGSLKIASAGSPDDLAGTSRRLVIMDDLAKFEMNDKGDPEAMALSRASGFDEAKILRISTPQVEGTCRISRAYKRSDQRQYHVPCPHCGVKAPLTWENFKRSINPERLHAAHFVCESCGCVIDHSHKMTMLQQGQWVADNPKGDHPGFYIWRAYAPQRDWASIAVNYAQVMGWTGLTLTEASQAMLRAEVDASTEQTFFNDVLGLPYAQASKGPDWQALRERAEDDSQKQVLPIGVLPARGLILAAGVDCHQDRTEVQVVAFGQNAKRWVIDYRVIPHHIGDQDGQAALDALLKATWKTELGLRLPIDMMAIDGGTFRADVWNWAHRHPYDRVIVVKGASTANGPPMVPMKFESKTESRFRRMRKQGYIVNVSQMKADFYHWLAKTNPDERGYCAFASGLGDEYYRQITAEVRVEQRASSGVTTSKWVLVDPSRRNEGLDTMNYAEAAALRKGWLARTADQWAALDLTYGQPAQGAQSDLFDSTVNKIAADLAAAPPAPVASASLPPPPGWLQGRIRGND